MGNGSLKTATRFANQSAAWKGSAAWNDDNFWRQAATTLFCVSGCLLCI